ncbi:Cell division control protein 24 [Spathaspora sp. JA1]|nr:Cell division control protein 24 [Spathaspora sp. JA1]
MSSSMDQLPHAFRSLSTSSNLSSYNSSTVSITRINSAPLNNNFNKQSSGKDHLYYQCESLKRKLKNIEGMEPYLSQAFSQAEELAEQQALALSQESPTSLTSSNNTIGNRQSGQSFSSKVSHHSDGSSSRLGHNVFTFTAGVLPANISVDPATHLWKLFQQGAPLCLIFNHIIKDFQISVISSDDLRICKKSVYDFLSAVKTHLNFDDEDMITISDVFSDNTEDLIKIIKVVNKLLYDYASSSTATSKSDLNDTNPNFITNNINIDVMITEERSKVFRELVETERKYVQDLELLIKYRKDLQDAELLSSEQINTLFPNLTEIIDFQRRFLNGIECNINVPIKYQRIGSVFIHASLGPFKAYEPWSIGQLTAIELINKEANNLKKSSNLLDAGFELQSYILKPIQRLCKYPLLLKELIKNSPESQESENNHSASYNELLVAMNAMKEVANQVNEAQRRAENVEYSHKLIERVSNWRGFKLSDQGELLHYGRVGVKDGDVEREYVAYLFERIIFFFVEVDKNNGSNEKEKKNKFSSRKKSTSSANNSSINLLESLNSVKDDTPLELRGRVYISEIYNISSPNNQAYTLIISWSGKKESGSFTLRYPSEEFRNQWESCLRGLKTNEINDQFQRRLHDSQISNEDNSIYEYTGNNSPNGSGYLNDSSRSSSGSLYHRHHSSSSTYSMMRNISRKSGELNTRFSAVSNASNSNNTPTTPSPTSDSMPETFNINIKIFYNSIEIDEPLIVSSVIQFNELYSKISSKIASSNTVSDDILVNKLKYKDEDGDFVAMDSNDDLILAIDMLEETNDGASNVYDLTIWVS